MIYYDIANQHRLDLIEYRSNGRALFRDLDEPGSTILCRIDAVDLYPRNLMPKTWPIERHV